MSDTDTTSTVALATSNFLSVHVPDVADVNVSSIAKVPVTSFIFNKPLSASRLTIVPEPPDELVMLFVARKVPDTPVTIPLLKKPKVGGVGDC